VNTERTAAQGHWLAVEFELRRVLDPDDALDAASALKDAGFTVTAPEHLRSAALVREGATDA
jgi:hypothetical protein